MALQTAIEDEKTGVEFNYWRLGNVMIFHDRKLCRIEILGYLNRDKYFLDKSKFVVRQYDALNVEGSGEGDDAIQAINSYDDYFAPSVLDAEGLNPQKQAYLYLKKLPDFAGAADVDL